MKFEKGALEGIRVLDATQFLSGPYCGMILGDLGADVIKVEKLSGDPARETAVNINGQSVYFMGLNRSKRAITLDFKNSQHKEVFLQLAAQSDIVLENFIPGTMQKLGISYEDVKKVNPKIIFCSISGFGATGPYAERGALDMVIQAMSGLMSVTGETGGRPVKVGPSVADMTSGLYACIAILAALNHRNNTGEGQYIDISMLDSLVSVLENFIGNYLVNGIVPKPSGNRHRVSAPFQNFETKDGEIIIAAATNRIFQDVCKALNRADLLNNPRYTERKDRIINVDELAEEITKSTKERTIADLETEFTKYNVPHAVVNTIDMVVKHPQIVAREMIVDTQHPVAGDIRSINSPIKMSITSGCIRRYSPLLGEHNYEILNELLGMSEQEVCAMYAKKEQS